jgi:hypothetical protein
MDGALVDAVTHLKSKGNIWLGFYTDYYKETYVRSSSSNP